MTEKAIDPKRQGGRPIGFSEKIFSLCGINKFLTFLRIENSQVLGFRKHFLFKKHNKCKFHSCLLGREMVTFEWSKPSFDLNEYLS